MSVDGAFDRVQEELARCPFHQLLRLRAVEAGEDGVTISLRSRDELSLSHERQRLHGGVLASLVDVAGHAAVAVRVGRPVPTTHLSVDFLAAATGPEFRATARVLEQAPRRGWARVTVHDDGGMLVAVGTGAFHLG